MSTSDSSYLFHKFLFHLRGSLSSIKSASQLAKNHPEKVSVSTLKWFEKWMPVIEGWISDDEKSRPLFHDGEEHNWEQLLQDMAENMKDISIAYTEINNLEAPSSYEGQLTIKFALNGSEHLNRLIQSVRSKDYEYFLQR